MTIQEKRLKILEEEEIEALYTRSRFTNDKRHACFSLSEGEKAAIKQLPIKTRIYFVLQLGYFKAQKQFFTFTIESVAKDLHYIHQAHYAEHLIETYDVSVNTRVKQQQMILKLCQYRLCENVVRQEIEAKATDAVKVSSKPIYIFRELMHYMEDNRIVIPPYSYLQDMIGKVLQEEQKRLVFFAKNELPQRDIDALNNLLHKPHGLYEITRLKHSPKDFGFQEMRREIKRGEQIGSLYELAKQLIPQLHISNESIKYYASLVTYYTVFRLSQLDEYLVRIYLLCFVFHRYQQFQDNLINYLIYQVRQYRQDAKQSAKERIYEYRLDHNRNLQKVGHVLKLFNDDTIAPNTPFVEVQSRAFALIDRSKLARIADDIVNDTMLDEHSLRWEYIDRQSQQFKRRLRPVLRTISLASSLTNDPLLAAIQFLITTFDAQKALWHYPLAQFPMGFVSDSMRSYLYTTTADGKKEFQHDRYEFLIYRHLRNRLEAGDVFCRDSIRFRSLEDDLLSDEQWKHKDKLIAESSLSILKQPIQEHLNSLKTMLEQRIITVNERIATGENESVTVKEHQKKRRWSLSYSRPNVPMNHPFFDRVPLVDMQTILHFVHQRTHFADAFQHILHRYATRNADFHTLLACLIAWGTNMGIGRMGSISDVSYTALAGVSDNFIRLETLQAANDMITNALAELPIFSLYHINDVVHSSSDGQKYETRLHTFNARYSSKYFGLQKGVVAYTLVANHIPINARIIGANEHESHFVFDLLYNNNTAVQPTIHSTDTHGANEINFALLHMFGYQFAPRYKDVYDKVRTSLYGFKHPSQYGNLLLKPIRKIQEPLVVSEWENVQRIFLSLALKTTTQYIVVRKLSSYALQNRTKRALWEYDNIFRSLYLLNYVDSLTLRQNVLRALNRGEGYHQLRRAVSHANFGKLRFRTEQDQQIWSECSRLLTNAIIYYNATILSTLLTFKEQNGDTNAAAQMSRISPVAWQHVNFYGRYKFNKAPETIDLEALIQELADKPLVFTRSG